MTDISKSSKAMLLLAAFAVTIPSSVFAQRDVSATEREEIIVSGQREADLGILAPPAIKGPQIKEDNHHHQRCH